MGDAPAPQKKVSAKLAAGIIVALAVRLVHLARWAFDGLHQALKAVIRRLRHFARTAGAGAVVRSAPKRPFHSSS